ncbi:MAG TPA: methylmalonyl Co-A mutase-associated GTPase MeaB [Chitinophagaceae bacterium]
MGLTFRKNRFEVNQYIDGVLAGDRMMLSKAITLVESRLPSDNELAEAVLEGLLPHTGRSLRIGITGVPGAGKSTFIESFGTHLTSTGKRIAVLTVDPSSQRSQGSILGDKTRMETLANDPLAFVRPSASGDTLGGLHSKTRETMLLCEASGFEIIIIETVGVGQSEISVKGIVDFFLLLMIAGAGDELQGIKRGIMEMADGIAINKADGDNIRRSQLAQREYQNALHLFPPSGSGWYPRVLTCSAAESKGIQEIWAMICEHQLMLKNNGLFFSNRQLQARQWMYEVIDYHLRAQFFSHGAVSKSLLFMEEQVESGKLPAIAAARKLLNAFREKE